jgi:YD repeat-containing protein
VNAALPRGYDRRSVAARRPQLLTIALLALLPLLIPAQGASQDGSLRRNERSQPLEQERITADRGPLDHLGWGTLEDLHVDLGAGGAISVFSGNLVVFLPVFPRADATPDSQLAITYNHLDRGGAPELAPGWSWDLSRFWAPGPWGDRVLVDGDGFVDSFFPGEPPDAAEIQRVVEDVVRAWKRDTPRRERRAAGGDDAMRAMLSADPLFFGEMRLRYLGPPPPPTTSDELVWRSSNRGERFLIDEKDGEGVLRRSDGGTELYDDKGRLTRIEPARGEPIQLTRDGPRIASIQVGSRDRWLIHHDSLNRLRTVRGTDGSQATFEYAGDKLWKLQSPAGSWRFGYDAAGRLTSLLGPAGQLAIDYDPTSGRVRAASGPLAGVRLGDADVSDRGDARVEVTIGGAPVTCSWDPRERLRRVEAAEATTVVRFEPERPLPIEVSSDLGHFTFAWDDAGRPVTAARGELEARFERDDDGRLTSLVDSRTATARIQRGSQGELLGWTDPAGRSTSIRLDQGRPRSIERPGGLVESVWWTPEGLLRSVAASGAEALELRRDSRGFLRAIESVLSGSAGASVDALGRLVRYEAPSGMNLELRTADAGTVQQIDDGRGNASLVFAPSGLLSGWYGSSGAHTVRRGADGRPAGLDLPDGPAWSLERDPAGVPITLQRAGSAEARFEWSDDGLLDAWGAARGVALETRRDRRGRVVELARRAFGRSSTSGRAERLRLELDRFERPDAVSRGPGRWLLARDASGRVTGVTDPTGAATGVQLDTAGRALVLAAPHGLRWILEHDGLGHLLQLRGKSAAWSLRYDRAGHPTVFGGPGDEPARLRWDRSGRWQALEAPGRRELVGGHGPWGLTRVGAVRRIVGSDGSLEGWGPQDELGGWQIDRDAVGRATQVRWRNGVGAGHATKRTGESVVLKRDGDGRPRAIGETWLLTWDGDRVAALTAAPGATAGFSWRVEREPDSIALDDGDGRTVRVRLDEQGDPRSVEFGDGGTFVVDRDSAGRVVSLADGEGDDSLVWRLRRDPLGRIERWELGDSGPVVHFEPMDGTDAAPDPVLAESLGVQVDSAPPPAGRPSGSRRIRMVDGDGETALEFTSLRADGGGQAGVEGFWGSTADRVLDQSPLVPTDQDLDQSPLDASPASDPLGDALDDALEDAPGGPGYDPITDALAPGRPALAWGAAPLISSLDAPFVPSTAGRGVGRTAGPGPAWIRLSGDDGGTVTWLDVSGHLQGLRLPRPGGGWRTPEGWMEYPAPPRRLDPPVPGARPAPHRGDAGGVERWWAALEQDADGLARLPRGWAGDELAWRRPRLARLSADALQRPEDPEAGPGALLPPVPGSSTLLPGLPGVLDVPPLTALTLAGELPPDADLHRGFLSLPPPAWMAEIPGATVLRHVATRRADPAVPPGWQAIAVAGLAPGLDGVLTVAGAQRAADPSWTVTPAVPGLPAGAGDLVPGLCEELPGAASLPIDGRCSSWEGLGDDPLVPGARRREATGLDALLLVAGSLRSRASSPLSGWLDRPRVREGWAVELPSGARVVVDERGRLLSADLGGRLRRADNGRAAATAGLALLHPTIDPQTRLAAPPWLPESSELPESRQGLAPAHAGFPLDALGWPALPRLFEAAGLPPARAATSWPATTR